MIWRRKFKGNWLTEARFPFKRNRLRCMRCVNENRKKRNRLRSQAANHGCYCFDRAFLLARACVCCVKIANESACVCCGFRLRNARNASDCVWMETGLHTGSVGISTPSSLNRCVVYTGFINVRNKRSSFVVCTRCVAEHKRFVQLLDMRFKDINAYMNEMSGSIDKYLQVIDHLYYLVLPLQRCITRMHGSALRCVRSD